MSTPSIFSLRAGILLLVLTSAFLMLSTQARADDVTDSIQEASEAYAQGEHSAAIESLNYAVQLIQQKKGKGLEALLPVAPEGWSAEEAESTAVGAAMFGGGVTAERRYTRDGSSVTVQIVTDSPMLQGMLALFSNPMFASSAGGRLEKIAGQKVMANYEKDRQSGDYKIAVDNRFLVTVTGEKVSQDEMKAFVEAIDFDAMKKS
ncbi:MAG: hypothetical protein R3E95_00405 [Thiolinea sp.]